GAELVSFTDHTGAVRSLQFATDNRTLISASADKTVRYFDAGLLASWNAHAGGVNAVAFHNNGTQALSAGADKTIKVWNLADGKAIQTLGPLTDAVSAVTYSRDFTQIGAATGTSVKIWNAADGKELLTLSHPAAVASLSFSADK